MARGSALNHYTVYEVGSDGVVDPFNDPIVTGLVSFMFQDEDDFGLVPDDRLPQIAPPVPGGADLNVAGAADALLDFTAPPTGGSYVLSAAVQAEAVVFLGGTAVSQASLGVDSVTVSHG